MFGSNNKLEMLVEGSADVVRVAVAAVFVDVENNQLIIGNIVAENNDSRGG